MDEEELHHLVSYEDEDAGMKSTLHTVDSASHSNISYDMDHIWKNSERKRASRSLKEGRNTQRSDSGVVELTTYGDNTGGMAIPVQGEQSQVDLYEQRDVFTPPAVPPAHPGAFSPRRAPEMSQHHQIEDAEEPERKRTNILKTTDMIRRQAWYGSL